MASAGSLASRLNHNISELGVDFYYHLGLNSSLPLKEMFGDVKFVLMCGSSVRAHEIILMAREALNVKLPIGTELAPIGKTERYSLYKCGPVLAVSHGMGAPSISILLHEITKLMAASGVDDPIFIRIGTSGGLGVEPGTVVVSNACYTGLLEPVFQVIRLGKVVSRPMEMDQELAREIASCGGDDINVVLGGTMGTDDFYEGQGRVDGAICDHTLEEKMDFLKKAHAVGVRNIEMETHVLSAFCTKLKIRCAAVCVCLLNRFQGDQVRSSPELLLQYQKNVITVVMRFIKKQLGLGMDIGTAAAVVTTTTTPVVQQPAVVASTLSTQGDSIVAAK